MAKFQYMNIGRLFLMAIGPHGLCIMYVIYAGLWLLHAFVLPISRRG